MATTFIQHTIDQATRKVEERKTIRTLVSNREQAMRRTESIAAARVAFDEQLLAEEAEWQLIEVPIDMRDSERLFGDLSDETPLGIWD